MPKTKERVAEKPAAKASTRAAAVKSTPPAKSSSRVAAAPVTAKGASSRVAATAKVEPPASKAANGKSASKLSTAKLTVVTKVSAKLASDRSEKADRQEKPERAEKAEKSERAEKVEKPVVQYKCPFAKDELMKWRQQLLSRRSEISSDIAGLEKDAMEAEDGHTTPNHIAERGSDADLQDVSLGIAGEEKDIIWQIDRALRKIDEHQPLPYGLCEYTKEAIPRNRLQLIPWTPLSIEGANHMEQNNIQVEDMLVDG